MKKTNIFKKTGKLLPFIIVFCILATAAIHYKLKTSNTYVTYVVIHYNDPAAEQGKTPTGDTLDVNDIKSSAVMSKVVEQMDLTGIYSVDNLISRITITPVPDEDKVAQKQAKLDEGEDYVYEPSTFIVSFTATNAEGEEFAREVLDKTLDLYYAEYSQKYVNVAPANNTIENIDRENYDYDYLEMMEMIDSAVSETLDTLYKRDKNTPYYRATGTGESFADLADDFNYIQSIKVSSLFSKIYKYQITKNKPVLISDYTTRIDNNNISNTKEESIINDIVSVINAYVEKMRSSGNTNISSDYILDNLHEKNLTGTESYTAGDQTVTYDELVYSWRDHNRTHDHAVIDSAYCQYVLNTFGNCTGACPAGECTSSSKTCTELNNKNYAEIRSSVDREIKDLLAELAELYNKTTATNDEYNEYLGASYISVLSSSSVKESVDVNLYTAIAFIFLIVLCCGGAIVITRVGDIINYVFYTDHMTGFSNRAYFDKYLKQMDRKLLDNDEVYCALDIANLAAINTAHSHEAGDGVIKLFALLLNEVFGKSDASLIYNGNGSFIVLLNGSDYISAEEIMNIFMLRLDEREEYQNIEIEYKIGIAETFREGRTARKLLAEAIKNKKTYISEAK